MPVETVEDDVEPTEEETDWVPHDSSPSRDYSSQTDEEFDGINSSNTVR